ncbi:MAG TPA: DUF4097 family beta strand repeat-containing protein [Candidatus Polarisedimenticolia bacterium]|nr:DUF4097 family beta strand repeat-containing protein [Candidatus Polarisedimenticolia bacterium]
MRRLLTLCALGLLVLSAPDAAAAEVTRTLRAELAPGVTGPFGVENLAGAMHVVRGSGPTLVAVATVHAESAELADAMRFEQVAGKEGIPTLRVIYPLDRVGTVRYPGGDGSSIAVPEFLSGLVGSGTRYDGRKVRVTGGSGGTLIYADVEVQVPAHAVEATFRNVFGSLRGEGVEGKMKFDTDSGSIKVEKARGTLILDTGSGNASATGIEGSLTCDTGSGNCSIDGFKGESITCDVGSGNVHISAASAQRVSADTGSGNVRVLDSDVETLNADTGSGNVILESRGNRLARIRADTGSGNVTLRLGPDASFEALADQGSGDIINRYADAQPILKRKELIGYRRGDGRTRITVDTGSGDLTLEPGGDSARNER